jgi:hypothetical protein
MGSSFRNLHDWPNERRAAAMVPIGENAEFAWHSRRQLDESYSKPDLIAGTPSAAKRYRSAD